MPELPEVERFRQTLLNLVSKEEEEKARLHIHLPNNENPPRVWLLADQIASLNNDDGNYHYCTDVLRKGKQLCMVLQQKKKKSTTAKKDEQKKYLFLHMGMTGSIRTPGKKICLGHGGKLEETDNDNDDEAETKVYPPRYAYLTFECAGYKVAFCDPRKFGKCILTDSMSTVWDDLAPDAWLCDEQQQRDVVLPKLIHQSMGIKGVLLDQKRACSGVGNWVADEVLYQCQIHPDQTHLTISQGTELLKTLQQILQTAVDCLTKNTPYPSDWLFQYRWTNKKAGSKDAFGRSITFLKSGGRTSAIIPTIQKLYKTSPTKKSPPTALSSSSSPKSTTTKSTSKQQQAKSTRGKSASADQDDDAQTESSLTTTQLKGAITTSKKRKIEKNGGPKSQKAAIAHSKKKATAAAVVSSITTDTDSSLSQQSRRRSPRFVTPTS